MADITIQQPITGELIPGYTLKKTITLVFALEDGEWLVSDTKFGKYGSDADKDKALENFKKSLAASYDKYEAEKDEDEDSMTMHLMLKDYIDKT